MNRRLICICELGLLIHGEITEQERHLSLSSLGSLIFYLVPCPARLGEGIPTQWDNFVGMPSPNLNQLLYMAEIGELFLERPRQNALLLRFFLFPLLFLVFYCQGLHLSNCNASPQIHFSSQKQAVILSGEGGKVLVEMEAFGCCGGLMAPLCVRFTTHSTGTILGPLIFLNQGADCLPSDSHILLVFDSWVLEHHLPSVFFGISHRFWNKFNCWPSFLVSGVRNIYLFCVLPATLLRSRERNCQSHFRCNPGSYFLLMACLSVLNGPDLGTEQSTLAGSRHSWDNICRVDCVVFPDLELHDIMVVLQI